MEVGAEAPCLLTTRAGASAVRRLMQQAGGRPWSPVRQQSCLDCVASAAGAAIFMKQRPRPERLTRNATKLKPATTRADIPFQARMIPMQARAAPTGKWLELHLGARAVFRAGALATLVAGPIRTAAGRTLHG